MRLRGGLKKLVRVSDEPAQLLLYRFAPGVAFQGQLAGVLERMEAGDALRVLDVVVVGADGASGDTFAIRLRGGRAGGWTAALLDFRLDAAGRAKATRRALEQQDEHGALIRELAEIVSPGETLVALLIGHAWLHALRHTVTGSAGHELLNAPVGPATLAELRPQLLAAAATRDA